LIHAEYVQALYLRTHGHQVNKETLALLAVDMLHLWSDAYMRTWLQEDADLAAVREKLKERLGT
jgi:hypothetical protein